MTPPVSLIDMDGSGLPLLFKLLKNGLQVQYSPFMPGRHLKALKVSEAARKLVANAINKGWLKEVKVREAISSCDILAISYIHWLNPEIDKRDLAYVYREVSDHARSTTLRIVQTGLHELGLMDWLENILQRQTRDWRLFYLPFPRIFKGRVPVGGPPIDDQVRPIVSAICGRKQLIPGLSYLEAEAATFTQLLSEAASYAAVVEVGLILYRRYGILQPENLSQFVGPYRRIHWRSRIGDSLLTLLEELEGAELQRSLAAGAISRVIKEGDRVVVDLLTKYFKSKKMARILLIGTSPQLVDKIGRKFKVSYLAKSELRSKKTPQKVGAAIIVGVDAGTISLLKGLLSEGGVIIDLSHFRLIKSEK
ncbi:hypothetical protein HRbin02_00041 [Candidatus Calditenuaceae archaeon HR02]|nr:hypothetical protein HRbin02_00041 [Candidatus Calditenuaceae archaeon HR02]